MIKIRIADIEYNIPSGYDDVKLSDYENWFGSEIITKEDEVTFVSKVSGIELNTLQSLPLSFYNDLVGIISFSLKDTIKEVKNSIEIDGVKYTINNEEELTLAEWIDVEESLKSESDKLSKILAVVCRPIGEAYDTNRLADRIELFKGLTMDKLFPLFNFFFALKRKIQSDYEPLFNGGGTSKPTSPTYRDFSKKWGWYKVVAQLANHDIQQMDNIFTLGVIEVFNFLSFQVDKQNAEEANKKFLEQLRNNK
ncbi:hypothetical protein [Dysgonomonas sp. 520]|uniref:hypothetical protein n=1 Tax=Dysgonomonas sp. 520 TaxID=2302931 RepID=UPI0013D13E19|nr:hypothetical protein [Dysgonomonas sp. 520]NDW10053.1 hypothetical protein [Dysgonomonas sp. 520]